MTPEISLAPVGVSDMTHALCEPARITEPDLIAVRDELASHEPVFHRPEWGTTRADFERMTAAGFWETGASGRRYSREFVLDELERRYASPPLDDDWESCDFHCQRLAADVYLLTYSLRQGARETRRSTIWERVGADWKIVFHQGTIVQDA
jgi:hypothetical protein